MRNVHSRVLEARLEDIQPWIARAWSGGAEDIYPRDIVRSWRKNPPDLSKDALVPGVTRLGHGPFAFRFEEWDGRRWRVTVEKAGYPGWHGFDLEPLATGCRITHTIELQLGGSARLVWPLMIAPLHDWIVEAMFDRLEEALRTGVVPPTTDRRLEWPQSWRFSLLRAVG